MFDKIESTSVLVEPLRVAALEIKHVYLLVGPDDRDGSMPDNRTLIMPVSVSGATYYLFMSGPNSGEVLKAPWLKNYRFHPVNTKLSYSVV